MKIRIETLVKMHRQKAAQAIRDQFCGIIDEQRAAYAKFEKGEITEKALERYEKESGHLLEALQAAEYQILNGPRKEFTRLIRIRKDLGLSQTELAKLAGISRPWYAMVEQGFGENVSRKQKEKIAAVFGKSYDEIFDYTAWWGKKSPAEIKELLKQ